jgi:aerobic-type carbon monoxide dehydrogenase small subunit (CoxS/CutS family)
MADARTIRVTVNDRPVTLECGKDFHAADTLADVLRERLGFTGLKVACDEGACGACTVLLDDRAVLSCMVLALDADGRKVLTIEGLPADDPVVEAFAEQCEPGYGTAMQCGFCTPGFVMAAKGFLLENPDPSLDEVREGLSGNLCRCGCYPAIAQATLRAAQKSKERGF